MFTLNSNFNVQNVFVPSKSLEPWWYMSALSTDFKPKVVIKYPLCRCSELIFQAFTYALIFIVVNSIIHNLCICLFSLTEMLTLKNF